MTFRSTCCAHNLPSSYFGTQAETEFKCSSWLICSENLLISPTQGLVILLRARIRGVRCLREGAEFRVEPQRWVQKIKASHRRAGWKTETYPPRKILGFGTTWNNGDKSGVVKMAIKDSDWKIKCLLRIILGKKNEDYNKAPDVSVLSYPLLLRKQKIVFLDGSWMETEVDPVSRLSPVHAPDRDGHSKLQDMSFTPSGFHLFFWTFAFNQQRGSRGTSTLWALSPRITNWIKVTILDFSLILH